MKPVYSALYIILFVFACFSSSLQAQPLTEKNAEAFAQLLQKDWKEKPEWAEMLVELLKGTPMDQGVGWFKPAETRLGWQWLEKSFDKNGDAKVSQEEASRFSKVFSAIDRNGDGGITKVDFDWSSVSHVGPQKPSEAIFFQLDRDSNGRVDQKEFMQMMAALDADQKGYVTPEDFTRGFAPFDIKNDPRPKKPRKEDPNSMLNMFFAGELGNMTDGPKLRQKAPDFTLTQLRSDEPVTLSDYRDKKIVVLNFGSFT